MLSINQHCSITALFLISFKIRTARFGLEGACHMPNDLSPRNSLVLTSTVCNRQTDPIAICPGISHSIADINSGRTTLPLNSEPSWQTIIDKYLIRTRQQLSEGLFFCFQSDTNFRKCHPGSTTAPIHANINHLSHRSAHNKIFWCKLFIHYLLCTYSPYYITLICMIRHTHTHTPQAKLYLDRCLLVKVSR